MILQACIKLFVSRIAVFKHNARYIPVIVLLRHEKFQRGKHIKPVAIRLYDDRAISTAILYPMAQAIIYFINLLL